MAEAWWLAAGFVVCAVWLGLGSAAQAAFGQVNAVRMRQLMQRGLSRSEAVTEVALDPGGLGAAIINGYLLSIAVAAGLLVLEVVVLRLSALESAGIIVAGAAILLSAQMFGRAIGVVRPEAVATRLYQPVRIGSALNSPLGHLNNLLVRMTLRRLLGAAPEERPPSTEEDLRALVDVVEETEGLEREEREMITGIFEMSNRDVNEIMVPRLDMVSLDSTTSVVEALDLAVSSGHSRFPVSEADLDHVLGMVHLRDLVAALRAGREKESLTTLVRPMHVVPETKKIDELLHEFQHMHGQMALVVDEYGGTAGLVTIEDLLEEIVGEIRDEYDFEEDPVQILSDHEAVMAATLSIHDANEALPLHLDTSQYETLAGLVYNELGRVPVPGDVVSLPTCSIKVLSTAGRRVQRVQVTLTHEAANGEARPTDHD